MPNAPYTGLHLLVPPTASNPFNAAPDFVGALLLTDAKCMILRMKVPTPTEEVIIPVGMTKRQCA